MKKYLVELLGKEESILLQENEIQRGILFNDDVIYLIKDDIKNIEEYIKLLYEEIEENFNLEYCLNDILNSKNTEFIHLENFITDKVIEKYINDGYKTIFNSSEKSVENIKELYSYSQDEYYIPKINEYFPIEYKEEIIFVNTLESNVYGETRQYKNLNDENKYFFVSAFANTEIRECYDFEIEEILNR